MLHRICNILYLCQVCLAYPKSVGTGSIALPSNGTWKNATWSFSLSTSTTESSTIGTSLLVTLVNTSAQFLPPLTSDASTTLPHSQTRTTSTHESEVTSSAVGTGHTPLVLAPSVISPTWKYLNGTFGSVTNSSISGSPQATGHVPPVPGQAASNSTGIYLNATTKPQVTPWGTQRYGPTGPPRLPFLNNTLTNTTVVETMPELSLPEEPMVKPQFRLAAAAAAPVVYPRAVFAHFMVGNVKHWKIADWQADFQLAKNARLDGFALNMAFNETGNENTVETAFLAAEASGGIKFIFSFDYAGGTSGPWPKEHVIAFINKYKGRGPHFWRGDKPLVSTFEGPDQSADWVEIKDKTQCFFMPDWSSVGAMEALKKTNGVADGLFSWAAWPWGNTDGNTYVDASYKDYLLRAGGKAYMMPVSPWFYTNMPGFDKNWLWRGDDLWRDRWEQVLWVKPDYVQIISWNDYGESHHIGPLRSGTYEAFGEKFGNSPFNYALDMPHDGWRALLPYYVTMYKSNITTISQEVLSIWYRTFPAASVACSDGLTTGNTASQLLLEFSPREVVQDKIFYSIVFSNKTGGDPVPKVTVGGVDLGAKWTDIPWDGIGVWHGSVAFGSRVGVVNVAILQGGATIMQKEGKAIAVQCNNGLVNWNAWTGAVAGRTISVKPTLSIDNQTCIEGTAPGNFQGLCEFTCRHGYCPLGACQCLKMGKLNPPPTPAGATTGYPIAGLGSSYEGLCDFACRGGVCPPTACGKTKVPLTAETVSPFLPKYCVGGTSHSDKPGYSGLCGYACGYGYCPMHVCTCTSKDALQKIPDKITTYKGYTVDGTADHGLCKFTCERGYCPPPCYSSLKDGFSICDPDEGDDCEEDHPCDYNTPYTSFEQIQALTGNAAECKLGHTLTVLIAIFDEARRNLTSIDKGYDSAFGHYADSVKEKIQPSIDLLVHPAAYKWGSTHFACTWAGKTPEACPINAQDQYSYSWKLYLELKDAAGFFSELNATYGIMKEWVRFDKEYAEELDRSCTVTNVNCFPSTRQHYIYGYPMTVDNPNIPNPKTILQASVNNMDALRAQLVNTRQDYIDGTLLGPIDDAIEVLSMPVFMVVQAVESMRVVKDIGEKAAAAEKRELIINIVSGILFFLPFAGQALMAAELVNLGRMIIMIAAVGEGALTMQDIIAQPSLAPLFLLDMLSKGRLRTSADFAEHAVKRRAIGTTDLGKLGPVYKRFEDKMRATVTLCGRR